VNTILNQVQLLDKMSDIPFLYLNSLTWVELETAANLGNMNPTAADFVIASLSYNTDTCIYLEAQAREMVLRILTS